MPVDYAAAALSAARRWCGWRVTPPEIETVTLDGPGGHSLSLPSLHIVELIEVIENGQTVDISTLRVSEHTGRATKTSGRWTNAIAGITVTMRHGLTTAPDFDLAVEQTASAMRAAGSRPDHAMTSKRVDDVQYDWSVALLQQSPVATALLAPYRILLSP